MSAWSDSRGRHRRLGQAAAVLFVIAASLLTAVWVAPRASGAVAEWMRTPPVRIHTLTLPNSGELPVASPAARRTGSDTAAAVGRAASSPAAGASAGTQGSASAAASASSVTLDAGMEFSMTGLLCDLPSDDAVTLRFRTSLDGVAWSDWIETPLEVAAEAGDQPTAFTDPLWTGAARYVQVDAAAAGTEAPPRLTGVRLVTIDPSEQAGAVAVVTGAARRLAASVAGVTLVPPASAAASAPTIVTRAEWGADESLRKSSPSYAAVKMAFVHHTASGNTYSRDDAAALVRGIYAYHTRSLGWNDIGYNFLVDRYGTIYEGRYGGMTRGVVGAQVLGFNTGSSGISVMGTFTDVAPPAAALASLESILSWKLATHGLDPAGTATLICGATEKYAKGAAVTFPVIAAHRQANYTACPGTKFNALLPAVRTAVAKRMGATVTARLTASETAISPNGDGALDSTRFEVAISTAATWTLTLRNAAGASVSSWSGEGTGTDVTWTGVDASGAAVPDGVYYAELTASSIYGDVAPAAAEITVDTVPPQLAVAVARPASFSPNGDGRTDISRVDYAPAAACTVRVGVLDARGVVRRWLQGWRAKGGATSVAWDGRLSSGGKLVAAANGRYQYVLDLRDGAGNRIRDSRQVIVDRRRPRLSAAASRAVRLGSTAVLSVKAVDPFSARVDLRFTVLNTRGRVVASAHPGWISSGKPVAVRFKPKTRGVYTIVYRATDLSRNREQNPARTRLTVR